MTPNYAVVASALSSPHSHSCAFSCPGWIINRTTTLFPPSVMNQKKRQNPFANHDVNWKRKTTSENFLAVNHDDAEYDKESKYAKSDDTIPRKKYEYKPPQHSEYFLKHLAQVKSSWPGDGDDTNNFDGGGVDSDGGYDKTTGKISGGVYCTGEPAMDPSRVVQTIFDGEADWV
ncbi:hypothetical protein ACHAXS_013781 [Conticribra weissflogii]